MASVLDTSSTWQNVTVSSDLCARVQRVRADMPGQQVFHFQDVLDSIEDRPQAAFLSTLQGVGNQRNEPARALILMPPAALTLEDTGAVTSTVQRLVEAVSYRAASEAQPSLIEQMEAKQDAIWEAEFQAQEWQQHLLQQRLARRSSLQRCSPSRSFSMPTARQQSSTQLSRGKSDVHGVAACSFSDDATAAPSNAQDTFPSVSEQCGQGQSNSEDACLPCIRVPSSISEVKGTPAVNATAGISGRTNETRTAVTSGSAYATPYMPAFGSSSKAGRQRRSSDATVSVSASLQPVLSLAAKTRTASNASAMQQGSPASKAKNPSDGAAASVKPRCDQVSQAGSVLSSHKGKLSSERKASSQNGSSSKGCAPTLPHRSRIDSLSRGQSLSAGGAVTQNLTNSHVLLNSIPQPPSSHADFHSSRSFFAQPSPGAILTSGAPAALQKKLAELMRRQSDTVKWEQKNVRSTEHRNGLSIPSTE